MALDTYANLKTALVTFSGRNDISVIIDDVIDMAEAEMFANDEETLQIRQMESTATGTLSTSVRTLALPTGYLSQRNIRLVLASGNADVLFRTPRS